MILQISYEEIDYDGCYNCFGYGNEERNQRRSKKRTQG